MNKKNSCSLLLLIMLFMLPGCSGAQQNRGDEKVLIVYLSRTENTKVLAEIIQKKVGGNLVALELEKPYPKNYETTVRQVHEELENGFLPPLKTRVENIGQYDVIYLGFPTWSMRLPPPVQSFLGQNPLKGKTVIPFNTNGGYGIGSSFDRVEELCPQARILDGFTMVGGKETDGIFLAIKGERAAEAERKVDEWLRRIGML